MRVLGISAYFHDSAAALVHDGEIVAAAQEERFSRRKHDKAYPRRAIDYCLREAGVGLAAVDRVVFYERPRLKRNRQLGTMLDNAPAGRVQGDAILRSWARDGASIRRQLLRELAAVDPTTPWRQRLRFVEHHTSHAAAAFLPSPFERAAILTVDAVGEWATTTVAAGNGTRVEILCELRFPHSLGMLYSAITSYLGFKVNSGEYKVMGLAPYGQPRFQQVMFDELIDLRPDGSFRLDMRYFDYTRGLRMTNERLHTLLGGPRRSPTEPLTRRHMDIASSIQAVTDLVMLRLAEFARARTGLTNLCMAGGVALNCVSNSAIRDAGLFDDIWVQPAAGDAGSALGAALLGSFDDEHDRPPLAGDLMRGSLLGPSFSQAEVEAALTACGATFTTLPDHAVLGETVRALVDGDVVGWFQGRMEFGPRALGARSILADPRGDQTQRTLNLKIKFRESFRPFAPVVLEERAHEWFDVDRASPYMLFVADVAANRRVDAPDDDRADGLDQLQVRRSEIPAVTHVDGTARLQTVNEREHPQLHALLAAFEAETGCPVLVNTSFNVRGEPIVCTPTDAFRCFMGTEMDLLVVGNCVVRRADQLDATMTDHHTSFEPD